MQIGRLYRLGPFWWRYTLIQGGMWAPPILNFEWQFCMRRFAITLVISREIR
jgi:hypothetical protein